MLHRILTVALNTYRESIRARILLGLAGVAFSVAMFSLVVGAFTLKDAPRVVTDLGAASISLFAIAVAVVIGATSLHRELEQKTIFPILARPIHRAEYLVGKYLGTLLTIFVFVAADTGFVLMLSAALGGDRTVLVIGCGLALVVVLGVCSWKWPSVRTYGLVPWALLMLVVGFALSGVAPLERRMMLTSSMLCMFEISIITALATLFSSFSSPFLSALFTVCVVVIGRNADLLAKLPKRLFGDVVAGAGAAMSKGIPNLQLFTPARTLLTGESADANALNYLLLSGGTALAWSVAFVTLGAIVFQKRDFL